MTSFRPLYICFICFAFFSNVVFCQNSILRKECVLITKNNNQFVGHIKHEFSDTIIFELNTGDELVFKQYEIANVFPVNANKENEITDKCGVFDIYIKGKDAFYGDQISITMNKGSVRNGGFLGIPFDTDKIRWIEFLEGDCEQGKKNSYLLRTRKNEKYIGQILSIDSSGITMYKPGYLQQNFSFSDIVKLRYHKGRPAMFGHEDYLFMGATGFNFKKKEGVAQSTYFLHNSLSFGLSDNLSLSSGLLYNNGFLRAKLSNDFGKYIHASISAGMYWSPAFEYGAAISFGVPDYFINGGYGKINGRIWENYENAEAYHLGVSIRVWSKAKIVAEFLSLSNEYTFFNNFKDAMPERRKFFNWGYNWINHKISLGIYYSLQMKEEQESIGSGRDRYEKLYFESMPKFAISAKFKLKKKSN